MILRDAGRIVDEIWSGMFRWAGDAQTWIIMPNHLHGVVAIPDADEAARKPLGRMIAAFKTVSTRRIHELRPTPDRAIWQRYFYEHIIRSDRSLERILGYIHDNPSRWREDPENPKTTMRTKAV